MWVLISMVLSFTKSQWDGFSTAHRKKIVMVTETSGLVQRAGEDRHSSPVERFLPSTMPQG